MLFVVIFYYWKTKVKWLPKLYLMLGGANLNWASDKPKENLTLTCFYIKNGQKRRKKGYN